MTTYGRTIAALCVAALGLGLAVAEGWCAEAPQDYGERMADAWALLRAGELKNSVRAFEKVERDFAGDEGALLGLANAHYGLGNYRKSHDLARRVLDGTPSREIRRGALHMIGTSLYMAGPKDLERLEEAEEALRGAVELGGKPGLAVATIYNLAAVLKALGRETEAVNILRDGLAFTVAPDHPTLDAMRILLCELRGALGPESAPPPAKPPDASVLEAHEMGEDVGAPVKLRAPVAPYPKILRQSRSEGVVIVQFIIDKEGCPAHVVVLHSFAELAELSVVRTIRRWVFRPATLNGRPVDVYYNVTMSMRLR